MGSDTLSIIVRKILKNSIITIVTLFLILWYLSMLNENSSQNYVVLARRTRPQSFSHLVGQDIVASAIEKMLSNQKIPHAFLFTGTRGTGKTSSARILAKSLCCEKGPTISPCQSCVHCQQITSCIHDDVLEIDGASHTGIDNIRELREATRFFPNSARYKIFIIDEVHMLSTGAFNALLKTLEEPPPQVIFILATTELHKVPITVRSRCMIFTFKKIEQQIMEKHLKNILTLEKIGFEDDAITLIAREAKGSIRDALSLLEQVIAICNHSFISSDLTKNALCVQGEEIAENIFSAICTKNLGDALELLRNADLASLDMAILMDNISQYFRNAMLIKTLNNKERAIVLTSLLPQEYSLIQEKIQNISVAAISEIFKLTANSIKDIARSNAGLAWSEIIITECISRAEWLSTSELMSLLSHSPKAIVEQKTHLTTKHVQENFVDLNIFKKFVALAEQKSKTLATRLNHVKVDLFNKNIIQFSDTLENKSHLSFNENDLDLFWQCIYELQLQNATFKGLYTPQQPTKQNPSKNLNTKNKNEQTSHEAVTKLRNTSNIMQSFQKYNSEKISIKSTELLNNTSNKAISLSEINHQEKNQGFLQKERALYEKDHIQQLKNYATEMQIIPVD